MEIRRLEVHDILPLRNKILRPKEIVTDYEFEGDHDESTLHLGVYIDGTLSSVATFTFEEHSQLKGKVPVRLRGMATLPKHRKKGLSKSLIETALPVVKQNQCDILWCEAREKAAGFYVGPHQVMFLNIKKSI